MPKVVGSIPTVVRHIFQACPVWIYTQSNITSIIFTWVHYTNTEKSCSKLLTSRWQRVNKLGTSSANTSWWQSQVVGTALLQVRCRFVTSCAFLHVQVMSKRNVHSIATNVAVTPGDLGSTQLMMSTSSMPQGRYLLETLRGIRIQLN
jgi:hypothetical protein